MGWGGGASYGDKSNQRAKENMLSSFFVARSGA
jgi:hypothetical protein